MSALSHINPSGPSASWDVSGLKSTFEVFILYLYVYIQYAYALQVNSKTSESVYDSGVTSLGKGGINDDVALSDDAN